jgi:hypothetical protein
MDGWLIIGFLISVVGFSRSPWCCGGVAARPPGQQWIHLANDLPQLLRV